MKNLPFEMSALLALNFLLLFLVAIEPYLLNLSIYSSESALLTVRNPVTQLYAIDFGSIYLILAYFMHQLTVQEKNLGRVEHTWLRTRQDLLPRRGGNVLHFGCPLLWGCKHLVFHLETTRVALLPAYRLCI